MEMDGEMTKYLFDLAEQLDNEDITMKDATEQLKAKGLELDQVFTYLSIYPCLLRGKIFKNTINPPGMVYYLDRFFETKGMDRFQKALQALSLHIDCYEGTPGVDVSGNREILNKYLASYGLAGDDYFEESITGSASLLEGRTKQITVNIYERNPIVRAKCIEHHGPVCQVCDLNFEIKYGKIGKGFIHVHHLIELSTIGDDYEVDPIHDLHPVCPNCHAMLHKKNPAYLVKDLWKLMNKGLQPTSYAKHWGFGG